MSRLKNILYEEDLKEDVVSDFNNAEKIYAQFEKVDELISTSLVDICKKHNLSGDHKALMKKMEEVTEDFQDIMMSLEMEAHGE